MTKRGNIVSNFDSKGKLMKKCSNLIDFKGKVFNQTMKILKLQKWLGQKLLMAFPADSNSDQNLQIVSNCAPM